MATYAAGQIISPSPYNTMLTSVRNKLGVGTGNQGLGQPILGSNVAVGDVVKFSDFSNLISDANMLYEHLFNSLNNTAVAPIRTDLIKYDNAIVSTLNQINSHYGNCFASKDSFGITVTNASSSFKTAVREASITFPTGDAARYFFNSGGVVILGFAGTNLTGNDKSSGFQNMINVGAPAVQLSYSKLTRLGTGYTLPVYLTNFTYYNLTTSYQSIFKITDTVSSNADYHNNYILIEAKTAALNVSGHADAGNVVYFRATLSDQSSIDPRPVLGNFNFSCYLRTPDETYLNNTWGNVNTINFATVSSS